MKTDNQVVQEAISARNAELEQQAVHASIELIDQITQKQKAIEECGSRITTHRNALASIVKDEITEANVYGGSIPRTANRETVAKLIEEANKKRQFAVEQKSTRLIEAITAEQDAITALNKSIGEIREKLAAIKPNIVTSQQIVG